MNLLTRYRLGDLELSNRMVMAPMTRCRARNGNEAIEKGDADLISFGVLFLANPDLPERFRKNAPLNSPDVSTFYMGEEKGYIDYSKLGY